MVVHTGVAVLDTLYRCLLLLLPGFGPVVQKDIDPSTAGGQYDGQTFTFTIPSSCPS